MKGFRIDLITTCTTVLKKILKTRGRSRHNFGEKDAGTERLAFHQNLENRNCNFSGFCLRNGKFGNEWVNCRDCIKAQNLLKVPLIFNFRSKIFWATNGIKYISECTIF